MFQGEYGVTLFQVMLPSLFTVRSMEQDECSSVPSREGQSGSLQSFLSPSQTSGAPG